MLKSITTYIEFSDFEKVVTAAKEQVEWENLLESKGVTIENPPIFQLVPIYIGMIRDLDAAIDTFWDGVYGGASAEAIWEELTNDDNWH